MSKNKPIKNIFISFINEKSMCLNARIYKMNLIINAKNKTVKLNVFNN